MGHKRQRGSHALVIITGPIGEKCHFPVDSEQRSLSFFYYNIFQAELIFKGRVIQDMSSLNFRNQTIVGKNGDYLPQ